MTVFAVAVATGDIIKYQSFVYGSFVLEIHVRYNKNISEDYGRCSGSVVECLTQERGVAGSSHTGSTVLCP